MIKAAGLVTQSSFPCTLGLIGRKARDFFVRRGFTVAFEETGIFQQLRFDDAQRIAKAATDAFLAGDVDRVMLVYNEFRSVLTQRVVVSQLLPIPRAAVDEATSAVSTAGAATVDYLYEPEPAKILDQLLPRYIVVQVARALLESNAAFRRRGLARSNQNSSR